MGWRELIFSWIEEQHKHTERFDFFFFLPVLFHFVVCRPAEIKQNTWKIRHNKKKPLIKMKKGFPFSTCTAIQAEEGAREKGLCGSLWTAGAAYKIRFKEGKKRQKKKWRKAWVFLCLRPVSWWKLFLRTTLVHRYVMRRPDGKHSNSNQKQE